MKKKILVVIAVIGVVLLATVFYRWLPGSVPSTQKPLVTLASANITQFAAAFDTDEDVPRVILLLSPT